RNQIEIALPVPDLDIGQAVPLLWQWQQGLRKQSEVLYPYRQFVGFRSETVAGNTDDVSHIQQLKQLKRPLAHYVELDVNLQPSSGALDVSKTRLPVQPECKDPACGPDDASVRFQAGCIGLGISGCDLGRCGSLAEAAGIRLLAERFDFGKLLLALQILIEWLEGQRQSFVVIAN